MAEGWLAPGLLASATVAATAAAMQATAALIWVAPSLAAVSCCGQLPFLAELVGIGVVGLAAAVATARQPWATIHPEDSVGLGLDVGLRTGVLTGLLGGPLAWVGKVVGTTWSVWAWAYLDGTPVDALPQALLAAAFRAVVEICPCLGFAVVAPIVGAATGSVAAMILRRRSE